MAAQWKWRDGDIGLKSFYQLNKEDKDQYIKLLESLPQQELSTCDEHILRFYSTKKSSHYFSMDDEETLGKN